MTLLRHYRDIIALLYQFNSYKPVPGSELDSNNARRAYVLETFGRNFFSGTVLCHHKECAFNTLLTFGHREDGSYFLVIGEGDEVHDRFAPRGPLAFRHVIHFDLVYLPFVSEEKEIVMCAGRQEVSDEILLFSIKINYSHPTTLLALVFAWISAFDVSATS